MAKEKEGTLERIAGFSERAHYVLRGTALIGSVLLPAAAIGLVEFGTYAIFVHGEIANRIKKRLAANKH
jgi:hypothetical protein